MAFEMNMIAAGENQEAQLEKWNKFDRCLFQLYKRFIPQEWNCAEGEELGANRRYVKVGLPWQALIFPLISEEEHQFIIDTFTDNGIDGLVTICAYDRDALEWKFYNATLISLLENRNFNLESGFYEDYRLEFRDMREI